MRLGSPRVVIFTHVARELAHNNSCEPLSKNSLDTHTLSPGCFLMYHLVSNLHVLHSADRAHLGVLWLSQNKQW